MDQCLFCKILDGSIPSEKVYEDDAVYAFRDIHPMAPTHILVIPRTHIPSMDGVTEENADAARACLVAIPKIAAREGVSGGYRVVVNCGPSAGQTVPHLHFHILGGAELGLGLA